MTTRTTPPLTYADKLSLVDITDAPVDGTWTDPNERLLFCETEQTWTKHVHYGGGWACGCGEFVGKIEKATP